MNPFSGDISREPLSKTGKTSDNPSSSNATVHDPSTELKATIDYVSARFKLDTKINLYRLRQRFNYAKVVESLGATIIEFYRPRASVVVYGDGTTDVTRIDSEEKALSVANNFVEMVRTRIYPDAKLMDFKMKFLQAQSVVPFLVRLETINEKYPTSCTFNPNFPTVLIFSLDEPGAIVAIYFNRSVIINTGSEHDLNIVLQKLKPIFESAAV